MAAGVAALGVAQLVAIGTGPTTAPVVAVGGAVIDLVPEPLKQFAIDVFGVHDKIALQIGTVVLFIAFAAVVGVLAARRWVYGVAGIAVFGVVGVAAALTRHNAAWTAALPTLAGALAAGFVLRLLLDRAAAVGDGGPTLERRRFLEATGIVLATGLVSAVGGRWLANRRNVAAERAAITLPAPADPAPPLPAEVDQKLPRLASFVTSNRDFYLIDTALVVPQVSPDGWKLRVHGRVRRPFELTYGQLLARPLIERHITLACVSNEVGGPLVGNARWLGVRIKDILDEAEPLEDADQVVSRSVDGFTAGTPTDLLRDGRDAMLAVGMNGEPLPVDHGFPVRMVVPGLYGYVSATKWLAEIELSRFADYDAYWIRRGWGRFGPIKTQSRIDTPIPGAKPRPGRMMVAGVAWAQHVGVEKVEVRVDGGPWNEARLAPVPSADTWRQWVWPWDATPGRHELTVRATDRTGTVQDEQERPVAPDGATGWHSVVVEVG